MLILAFLLLLLLGLLLTLAILLWRGIFTATTAPSTSADLLRNLLHDGTTLGPVVDTFGALVLRGRLGFGLLDADAGEVVPLVAEIALNHRATGVVWLLASAEQLLVLARDSLPSDNFGGRLLVLEIILTFLAKIIFLIIIIVVAASAAAFLPRFFRWFSRLPSTATTSTASPVTLIPFIVIVGLGVFLAGLAFARRPLLSTGWCNCSRWADRILNVAPGSRWNE
jgi:hypothetical protein